MPTGERTGRVVLKLRKVCKERGLSANDVYEMVTLEYGRQEVSKSSIIRILREDSDPSAFQYSTVKPIVKVVLGTVEDTEDADSDEFDASRAKEYFLERNALQEVVRLKAAEEERLRVRLELAESSSKEELARLSLLHDQNISRLLELHKAHDQCQEETIEILRNSNEFLQQTVENVRRSLCEERESKKHMYEDVKKYIEQLHELALKVAVLEAYHHNEK